MKILQATYVRGVAGSEKFLLNLLPELKKRGHQTGMLILYLKLEETTEFVKPIEKLEVPYYLVPIGGTQFLKALPRVRKIFKNYDVVNSHLLHADFTLALSKMCFLSGKPLVSGKHGFEEAYNNAHGFDPAFKKRNKYWWTAKIAELAVNKAFAISGGLHRLYTGLGISRPNTELIYYGFDFAPAPEPQADLRFGQPQYIIVGRLTEFKGHRFAIEAMTTVLKKHPDAMLVLVGWGQLEETLKKQVQQLQLEKHVRFEGFQSEPRSYMTSSDVVLIPSVAEGFGIVVAEAMSCRRPIIAFDVPSPNEILHNEKSAILVKPYDVEAYAQQMLRLAEDQGLAQNLANEAYGVLLKDYSLQEMTDRIENIYKQVVK